jgi:hypothetical protein
MHNYRNQFYFSLSLGYYAENWDTSYTNTTGSSPTNCSFADELNSYWLV